MTPIQELTAADLTTRQMVHLTGVLAVNLDTHGAIDREVWTKALIEAKASPKDWPA
jgi:hypothetical protein